ncbi:MAG: hypothetical protein WAQ28_15110 [Bacteroidia bacterium]|jgi:uncharacterized protein involved in propanediol utilization
MKKLCLLIAGIGILSIATFAQEGAKPKTDSKKTAKTQEPSKKLQRVNKPMKQKPAKKVGKAKAEAAARAK